MPKALNPEGEAVEEVVVAEEVAVDPYEERFNQLQETLSGFQTSFQEVTNKISEYDSRFEEMNKPPVQQQDWTPETWSDIPKLVEEKGKEIAERVLQERDNLSKLEEETKQKELDDVNGYIDKQILDAEKKGLLPKGISDSTNESVEDDRKELFSYMLSMGTVNVEAAAKTLNTFHKTGNYFDPKVGDFINKSPQLEGKTAPIAGNSGHSNQAYKPSYQDIRGLSMQQLADRMNK